MQWSRSRNCCCCCCCCTSPLSAVAYRPVYAAAASPAAETGADAGIAWPCNSSRAVERLLARGDRKSTRLNSSHLVISYAVFCLKKKKKNNNRTPGDRTGEDSHINNEIPQRCLDLRAV